MHGSVVQVNRTYLGGTQEGGIPDWGIEGTGPGDGLTVLSGSSAEVARSVLQDNARTGVLVDGRPGFGSEGEDVSVAPDTTRCTLTDSLVIGSSYFGATQNGGLLEWEEGRNEVFGNEFDGLYTRGGLAVDNRPPPEVEPMPPAEPDGSGDE